MCARELYNDVARVMTEPQQAAPVSTPPPPRVLGAKPDPSRRVKTRRKADRAAHVIRQLNAAQWVGSLNKNPAAWHAAGASRVILRWVRLGCPLYSKGYIPRINIDNPPMATEREEEVTRQVEKLVVSGAAREVSEKDVRCVSPVFVIPKRQAGKWRLIHDLREVNRYIHQMSFRFNRLNELGFLARETDVAIQVDLKSGYHQMFVAEEAARVFGFRWQGKVYRMQVLPFGWTLAPYVFQKVMNAAMAKMRRAGVRVLGHLDDFLFLFASAEQAARQIPFIRKTMAELGLVPNEEKSCWDPRPSVLWLGFVLDFLHNECRLPPDKRQGVKQVVGRFLSR